MDYQTSSSCTINSFAHCAKKSTLTIFFVGVLFLSQLVLVSAQEAGYYAPNPLTETVTVTAIAPSPIIPPQVVTPETHPQTTPVPPAPVNLVDTVNAAIFKGTAYPDSIVSVLKNGQVVGTIPANPDGTFDIRVRNLDPGTYSFALRAEDKNHTTSKLVLFTVFVSSGVATLVEGIIIPPTITSDKSETVSGEPIVFSGYAAPLSELRVSFIKDFEVIKKTKVDALGAWSYKLDSSNFPKGDYQSKAMSVASSSVSLYSELLSFTIGSTNKLRGKISSLVGFRKQCDLNNDNRVNLLDFSIMAFWYKRIGFPPKVDLNSDTKVNLTDLSILAYCWTG